MTDFIIRQDDSWLCCFAQDICKLEKCHLDFLKSFRTDRHLWLRRVESFLYKHNGGVCFPFSLDFLVWVVPNHDVKTSASEVCISHQDNLFFCERLPNAVSQASLSTVLTVSNVSLSAVVMLTGISALSRL